MKAMMLTGKNRLEFMDIPDPVIGNDSDVLIKIDTVGVCGTDIHYYRKGRIGSQAVEYPFLMGHECSGIVEKTGAAVTNVKPGDRIAVDPATPCYKCDQCITGRHHTCRNVKFIGCPGESPGCLSEFILMSSSNCYPLSTEMTMEQASISEPLSIGIYAVNLSIPIKGSRIGILGAGPIGLSVLLPAIAMGAERIYVTDKIKERLDFAKTSGAAWTGNPDKEDIATKISEEEPLLLDAVFECCGQQEAMDDALKILKPGGKLMVIGIPESERWSFEAHVLRRKEICIQNVRRQNMCMQTALDMIDNKIISVDNMVSHRFSFGRTKEAFDTLAGYRDGAIKVMIKL